MKHIYLQTIALSLGLLIGVGLVAVFPQDSMAQLALVQGTNPQDSLGTSSLENDPTLPVLVNATTTLTVPIFVYHSVRPEEPGRTPDQDAYDITPELFERHLAYLAENGYTSITYQTLVSHLLEGETLPPKSVVLAFDDGWKNQYEYALPLLEQYGMRATFFIFSNPIGKKPQWMSWEDIVDLESRGMEIAGHTRTHPKLTLAKNEDELIAEIEGGKEDIEGHLGHEIVSFAYPFGLYNEDIVRHVERAGYWSARTIVPGSEQQLNQRFELHGILVTDQFEHFVAQLN